MKVTEAEKKFTPSELKILVEDETDLTYLWLAFNLGEARLREAYKDCVDNTKRLDRIAADINSTNKSKVWDILDKHMSQLGL